MILIQPSKGKSMFYEFYQNNSYGYYLDPAEIVIVEAESAEEANSIALENGIYFCGVRAGKDCSCCGDRWSQVYEGNKIEEADFPVSNDRKQVLIIRKKGVNNA